MAPTGKVETEVEIKVSADKFYKIFSSEAHKIPNISSDTVHAINVHEGDWETPGSLKQWNYTLDGKTMSVKETVEIDEENKKVTFNLLEGDIMEHFKSFKTIIHPIPKGEGALVKWTLEYEALDDVIAPSLNNYVNLAHKLTKDIEAHLAN